MIAPLLVLGALKPRARNLRGVGVDELFLEPPASVGLLEERPPKRGLVSLLPRRRRSVALRRASHSRRPAQEGDRKAVAFVTQRLNGEDGLGAIFPRHGQFGHDVRRARLPGGTSGSRGGATRDRQAAHREGGRGLLPALRFAGLGYGARVSRAHGGRHGSGDRRGGSRARMGAAVAGSRFAGDWAAQRPEVRPEAGLPIQQRLLPGSRRHRRRGDGDGPRATDKRKSDFPTSDRTRR